MPSGEQYEIKGSILYCLREGKEPSEWKEKGRKRRYTNEQRRIWQRLDAKQLEMIERSIFDLLGIIRPVIWIIVVKQDKIYRKHRETTWPPYYWALTYVQQRVVHHVQATRGAYERALFIMDENVTLKTAAQFDEYLSLRERINGTAPWPVDFNRYLIDIPAFTKSHLHSALQIADVIAHAAWRRVTNRDRFNWLGRVEALLAKHWRTGTYENAGLTFIQ